MYEPGQMVKVKDPQRTGWLRAKFGEVAVDQPKHIDHPGLNAGAGYDVDQAWVTYEDGELAGTSGLHPINEEIRPADWEPA